MRDEIVTETQDSPGDVDLLVDGEGVTLLRADDGGCVHIEGSPCNVERRSSDHGGGSEDSGGERRNELHLENGGEDEEKG